MADLLAPTTPASFQDDFEYDSDLLESPDIEETDLLNSPDIEEIDHSQSGQGVTVRNTRH